MIQDVPEKKTHILWHHNVATIRPRVMRFLAKCRFCCVTSCNRNFKTGRRPTWMYLAT